MGDDYYDDDEYLEDDYDEDDEEYEYDDGSISDGEEIDVAAAIAAYEAKTDSQIEILRKNKDIKEKIKAVLWLGESGNTRSIPVLVQAYKKIKNQDVHQAIAYALGQFRALDESIEREIGEEAEAALQAIENQAIDEQINNIILHNKLGSRRKVPQALLMVVFGILLISFLGLSALTGSNVVKIMNATAVPTATLTPTATLDLEPDELNMLLELHTIRGKYDEASGVVKNLQSLFGNAITGTPLDCEQTISELSRLDAPQVNDAVNSDLSQLTNELNDIVDTLNADVITYNNACLPDSEALQPAVMTGIIQSMRSIQDRLNSFNGSLNFMEYNNPVLVLTPIPMEDIIPSETPTETSTPTPDASLDAEAKGIIASVNFRLGEVMKEPEGPVARLEQYWSDVEQSGGSGGCNAVAPAIPEDFVLSEALASENPALATAIDTANTGLQTVRDGWLTFTSACTEQTLAETLASGKAQVQLAQIALESAIDAIAVIESN